MTTSERSPCHVELVLDASTTAHTLEEALPSAVATNCKSLVLRTQYEPGTVSSGAAVARALARCPNVQYLRVRLAQGAVEYVSLADLDLGNLRTLDLQCFNATVHVIAGVLLQCPNLQALSLGTLGRDLRQTGPAPRLRLPHLTAYAQTTVKDVFLAPLYACAGTLRALTLFVNGPLPDLGHLRALSRLTLTITGNGLTRRDKKFPSALLAVRTLRHLALEHALVADHRLFDAVAALMPQLVTLGVRVRGPGLLACYWLSSQLPHVFRGGARAALRALKVTLGRPDADQLAMLRGDLDGFCRPRRVRLILELLN